MTRIQRIVLWIGGGALLWLLITVMWLLSVRPAPAAGSALRDLLLIDPGHGGEDGGARAADGTLEKNINLAIGLDLRDMLQICGIPVAMTREEDVSIGDPGDTTRSRKSSDMHRRLELYQTASTVLSIHQNHFSAARYHGAQMFYSGNHPDSRRLAEEIRRSVVTCLQPENTRELKLATDGIFLMYHAQCPAVLVEGGFLSNDAERERLKETEYQQKIAWCILAGYLRYRTE